MPQSGVSWVTQFPTSTRVNDLEHLFRSRVAGFLDALTAARARVQITATLRPPQRAYLMHYAWCIARQWQGTNPATVPRYQPYAGHMTTVDIQWLHRNSAGQPDIPASRNAAQRMVQAFGIIHLGVPPALNSLHIRGQAIDMLISWHSQLSVIDAHGHIVQIDSAPRDGTNAELIRVGASYGVIHLINVHHDPPHWSINGH
jgi:hypothetical protein